ncbi:hypothetical protein BDM02DRAFT_3157314 [Thelephora ganbajun]|uniref:Uncharacterized protein n=1 Tax=Thelephora ganbajun TaxID=370292 RepID=A0ACB6Z308_THEGA|nr:hypothetical protein BDM02DRAFT_3157314 [Thelephora ganbajun]
MGNIGRARYVQLGDFSYLPDQRLSRCTCPCEDHPGPMYDGGTFVGRSTPEIDVFESALTKELNSYTGGAPCYFQRTNNICYDLNANCYAVYGFKHKPGFVQDNAYVTWTNNDKSAWMTNIAGTAADDKVNIGPRPVSTRTVAIDFERLTFLTVMSVDYMGMYQRPSSVNTGCDPDLFPAQAYIKKWWTVDVALPFSTSGQIPATYMNPNFIMWRDDYQQLLLGGGFKSEC